MAENPNAGLPARISTMTYYRVEGDSDCEGRGPRTRVGCFLHEDSARNAAQGKGAMGSMGYIIPCNGLVVTYEDSTGAQVMFVLGEKIEQIYENPVEIRKRALAKLSAREIEILGLNK
jgi:hypothetical protein